jgi:hypothetical protein
MCTEVEWRSVVKCSESLINRVCNIIRRYMDHLKFAAYKAFFFYHIPSCHAKTGHGPHYSQLVKCVVLCIFCVPTVLFYILYVCKLYCTTATGCVNLIAVNKYIISHQKISRIRNIYGHPLNLNS